LTVARSRPARWRTGLVTICSVVVAVLVILAPGLPAQAAPSPGEIENQINDAWEKLEPIIEQYNKVHAQLQDTQSRIDGLQRQIDPLQMQVDLAMTRVGALSADLYKTGPGSRALALVNAGSPTVFADQMTTLEVLAHRQRQQVAGVAALRDGYAAQKKPLDDLKAQLSAQDADLAAKKKSIETQLDDLQKLRLAAYGSAGQAAGNLRPVACPMEYFGDKGSQAAKKACSLIGKPYIWGAAGSAGYDCSGLTLVAWAAAGVTLQHYTGWQWNEGKPVTRAQLRPGDLVFFYQDLHHMGIYVGGDWMVHSPHTGDYVRMAPIDRGMPIAGFRRPA
jgi:cell wall-associated NlpC family hydrolase